ncbi:MAG TPA: hypothetical protein VLE22_02435, partial [Bryobacteraceae bacterium]|nr:hypothetical protein [Bryobacteraceae bacterium]
MLKRVHPVLAVAIEKRDVLAVETTPDSRAVVFSFRAEIRHLRRRFGGRGELWPAGRGRAPFLASLVFSSHMSGIRVAMVSPLCRRVMDPRAAVLFTILIVAASAVFAGRVQQKMRDFEVYWTAGARVAASQSLYRESDGHYRFKYLPAFAVAVSPLARLPLGTAKAVWFAVSVACLV